METSDLGQGQGLSSPRSDQTSLSFEIRAESEVGGQITCKIAFEDSIFEQYYKRAMCLSLQVDRTH